MDKRAAGQYLTKLFGKGQGHVAVAYKDKGESWQECTFQYPAERTKLIAWADIHKDANVFICPALRQGRNRVKGDMVTTRWLWADVDWDKVPDDKYAEVQRRIAEVGTLVVNSGSGENAHVYVQVDRHLTPEEHYRLNTGLKDYLYADAKHADNSLLRLPGTTNWKTDAGSAVVVRRTGEVHSVDYLMEKRTFQRVKASVGVAIDGGSWTLVDVSHLPRRIRAMGTMDTDQAVAKYGKRHKAVWGIAGELHKRGLDADQIHTIMDQFPAGVEKNAEEHNGYDLHRDIDKRLIYDRANGLSVEDEIEDDAGDVFEEMSVEEVTDALVAEGVEKELLRRAIRKAADTAEAERGWVGPPDDVSWSLTDALSNPPEPLPYLIDGLAGKKHNVVITAQYKTGKTSFTMGAIAYSLADGVDFLDHFPVHTPTGGVRVGHWNCEMDPAEMVNDYIRPVGIQNTDNLVVANLRGYRVNILTPLGKQWAVDWLTKHQVKVWTIDSFARLARMAGVSEKDNDEVMSLLMALDEIKVEADIDVLFLITHTGRAEMEEGKERARGATAIDDWADARWIMTKMDDVRFLAVDGRGVSLESTALHYDKETGRSTKGFGGKTEVKADGAVQTVVKAVKENPGCSTNTLFALLKGAMSQRVARTHIEEAIENGFIETKTEVKGRGKPAVCHYLAGMDKPTGDRTRRATPAVVDVRAAVGRRRRPTG
jgi:hypothetical protein